MQTKQILRQHFRSKRQHLTRSQQKTAELAILERIIHSNWFLNSRHIACYVANDGEIRTKKIIEHIWQKNKLCYLPVLSTPHTKQMKFTQYQRSMRLKANRFNIMEPPWHKQSLRAPEQLDLVLLPLVAFDGEGHRLGMGAGYYDRHFAFRQHHQTKPLLVGLAYECQKASTLPTEAWDVPLDKVITEQKIRVIELQEIK